jgi:hypothetical protein
MAFFVKWYEDMNQCQSFICFMGTKAICKCTMWGKETIYLNNFFSCWSFFCIMKTKAICKSTKWINYFSYGLPFVVWKQMNWRCTMQGCETNSLNHFTLIICVKGRWCVNMPISSMHNINDFFFCLII